MAPFRMYNWIVPVVLGVCNNSMIPPLPFLARARPLRFALCLCARNAEARSSGALWLEQGRARALEWRISARASSPSAGSQRTLLRSSKRGGGASVGSWKWTREASISGHYLTRDVDIFYFFALFVSLLFHTYSKTPLRNTLTLCKYALVCYESWIFMFRVFELSIF